MPESPETPQPPRAAGERPHTGHGFGRVLVAVYGLLALAATGRSILQISEYFDRAPVPYILSALAAVIYIVATIGLARGDRASVRLATIALVVELLGVLVVGIVSYRRPVGLPRQDGLVALRRRLRLRAARAADRRALVDPPHVAGHRRRRRRRCRAGAVGGLTPRR